MSLANCGGGAIEEGEDESGDEAGPENAEMHELGHTTDNNELPQLAIGPRLIKANALGGGHNRGKLDRHRPGRVA